MMKRFDLFGSTQLSLASAADAVASALGVAFELHDSSFFGGDYYRSLGPGGEEILVQSNSEDEEGYLTEPDFAEFGTLVYVNRGSAEFARPLELVSGLDLLRSELI